MPPEPSDTIDIPADTARVAHRELDILIQETHSEPHKRMTPLAALKERCIRAQNDIAPGGPRHQTFQTILDAIEDISSTRGIDTAPADPLQADIFRAHHTLSTALNSTPNADQPRTA